MKLTIETDSDFYKQHNVAYVGDAGIDLYFLEDFVVPARTTKLIDLCIKCSMEHEGNFVSYFIYPRSSIYKTPLRMSNSVGVIDSLYRSTLKVAVDNISDSDYNVLRGTRLFQICHPCLLPINVNIGDVSSSTRGDGFGSSGV